MFLFSPTPAFTQAKQTMWLNQVQESKQIELASNFKVVLFFVVFILFYGGGGIFSIVRTVSAKLALLGISSCNSCTWNPFPLWASGAGSEDAQPESPHW